MEANFSKLFIGAGGGLLGAILGGCFAGWRAAAAVRPAAQDPDLIANASPHAFAGSAALVIKGIFWGGVLGVVITIALLVYFSSDRIQQERKVEDTE